MSPHITILCPDLRSPSLGAAVRLRELLLPWAVDIVGPDFGGGVCSMYRHAGPFTVVPTNKLYRWPDFFWESKKLEAAVRGRVVIALKAYMNTVPVALRLQQAGQARAVVFLDEWDGAVLSELSGWQRITRLLRQAHHPLEDSYYPMVERKIREAATVLSTTTFLQKKFGGHVIAMGVDVSRFAPRPADVTVALRREMKLDGVRVIAFGGVVRPHKGVEQILEALVRLGRHDVVLLVIGPITEHLEFLMNQPAYQSLIRVAGAPMKDAEGINAAISQRMPDYLDLADLIVLPLIDNPLSRSQMPIKLFEAMTMAKPIIGSAVADLPRVLDGCGWSVPPGDGQKLAETIAYVLDHPDEAKTTGEAARAKCTNVYSRAVAGEKLKSILQPLLSDEGQPVMANLQ